MEQRLGWAVSLLIHVCVGFATVVNWPAPDAGDGGRGVVVTPVEIVDIADVADVLAEAPVILEEAATGTPEPPEDAPAAATAPTPQPRPEQQALNLRSLDQELLENREERPEGVNIPNARRGEHTRAGVGLSRAEQATIESRIAGLMNQYMRRCWRAPADASDPGRLVVELQITLDPQGRLDGRPRVLRPTSVAGDPELRVAVDRAIRAAFQCNPYPFPDDPVVAEHYDLWRENTYVFHLEQ